MKKKNFSKAIIFMLVAILTLSFCACGGNKKANENKALAKENVYKIKNIDLPKFYEANNGYTNFHAAGEYNGRKYFVISVYDFDTYSNMDYRIISTNEDGGDVSVKALHFTQLQPSENLKQRDWGYSDDDYGILYEEGIMRDTKDVSILPVDEDFPEVEDGDCYGEYDDCNEDYENIYEYVDRLYMAPNGYICGIRNWNYDSNKGYEERKLFTCWDLNGEVVWENNFYEMTNIPEESYAGIKAISSSSKGGIVAIIESEETKKVVTDDKGNVIECKALKEDFGNVFTDVFTSKSFEDGSAVVFYYDTTDYAKVFYRLVDFEKETMGDAKQLNSEVAYNWNAGTAYIEKDMTIYYASGDNVYKYKEGDAAPTKLMDAINSDLYISSFNYLCKTNNDDFIALYYEDWNDGVKIGNFTYVKPEDIKDKAALVLAGIYLDSDIKKRVIDYNKNNDESRIVYKDYSVYNTYEDYDAGKTKLNSDIIAGNMPDILVASDNLPIDNYISKGWLADIGKLIDDDPDFSREDLMTNVFDAYSVDGKWYYLISGFGVNTMIAKTDLVGNYKTWSMKDAQKVLQSMADGATLFGTTMTRGEFINNVMRYCTNQYIDISTGKCSFNTEDFISMMEYAKTLPEELNYEDDFWRDYWEYSESQWRENKTLLKPVYLNNFEYIITEIKGYVGNDYTYAGFPTGGEMGSGAYINDISYGAPAFVLAKKSSNLDLAWGFVRYYLTDEYQKKGENEYRYCYSVIKKYFEKDADVLMERPHWTDYDGNVQYYDYTIYLNNEEIVVEPFTKEEKDRFVKYIESVNKRSYTDSEIYKIIEEEIAAYFSGQKSVQEAVDIIQRRAQIYVDTNR